MTFVIITGGIDLSVSGVVALTTVASAALIRNGWNPWIVIPLMLLMGMTLGATMGSIITFMKVQPFIATLAGCGLHVACVSLLVMTPLLSTIQSID
jgi:simple sugar transport system permease protein